ncbi:MAG: Asp/Glu/hydantoin racemase [bacterium]|nr:Asp/Glu/hydantoin racemase [bacterium]
MRILILNPNSDDSMTRSIQRSAEEFAAGEFEVRTVSTPGSPAFIDTYQDQLAAAPGMETLVREHEVETDAFINACHCDPNLDALKEMTDRPVVGIGEASMKMATMLGHRFSVVSTGRNSIPGKKALARKYHLDQLLVSVRAPIEDASDCSNEELFLSLARTAVDEDMAEVIVLGCAGLTGMDKKIQRKLGVPVLDGVVCALIIATGMARYGVSTSKVFR